MTQVRAAGANLRAIVYNFDLPLERLLHGPHIPSAAHRAVDHGARFYVPADFLLSLNGDSGLARPD